MTKKVRRRDWFDAECRAATDNKNVAYRKMLQRNSRSIRAQYKLARRKEKKIHKHKKRVRDEEEVSDINGCGIEMTLDFYKNVKQNTTYCADSRDDSLLPTIDETVAAINRLKNHRSPGQDGIPAEILKQGGPMFTQKFHMLIEEVWLTETMPEQWNLGVIIPLLKKGDTLNCQNYRGITLLNTAEQDDVSPTFATHNGLRQGDALACRLSNVALEKCIRDADLETRGTIFYKSIQVLDYADDLDLITRNKTQLQEAIPKEIATLLNLPEANEYTGHSFRRSSATLLADSGADLLTLKRHGGWRSSSVAEGYIDDSLRNKEEISSRITRNIHLESSVDFQPSTSTQAYIPPSSLQPQPTTAELCGLVSPTFTQESERETEEIKGSQHLHPLKFSNSWAQTDDERAEVFATHLEKVFKPNDGGDESDVDEILNQDLQLCLPLKPTSPKEIASEIRRLNSNKAPEFDLITPTI
ncbi:unnamed protein product [Leptosia nina]|uniref:Tyr recombinase domain-containing protein n=1 Tax=Leptosia nina TaxID=320188 RepID=A0AAV1K3F1_9NEOP